MTYGHMVNKRSGGRTSSSSGFRQTSGAVLPLIGQDEIALRSDLIFIREMEGLLPQSLCNSVVD